MVPVVICTAGAPDSRKRRASLSVARSPTTTAQRRRRPNRQSVSRINVVLPEPGEDRTLMTKMPRLRNSARLRAASRSFLSSIGRPSFSVSRVAALPGFAGLVSGMFDLQRADFQFPPAPQFAGPSALGAFGVKVHRGKAFFADGAPKTRLNFLDG